MKSILSTIIFVLVLFLSLFFFPFLRPSPALATACCQSGGVPIDDTWCNYGSGAKGLVECNSSTEKCNFSANPPVCIPKSQAQTKDPTCGPAPQAITPTNGASDCSQTAGKCCKGIKVGLPINDFYACEGKHSPGFVIKDCNEMNDDTIIFVPKDYCGGDPLWKYDEKTRNCVQFAESSWDLKKTCLDGKGVETGIGCIPVDNLQGFLEFVLKWAFFASGGIIVLMVIATGYTLLTSQGNPEKLQAAKENIVALFSGLILIAFSLVLLQAIGADILKLPTF